MTFDVKSLPRQKAWRVIDKNDRESNWGYAYYLSYGETRNEAKQKIAKYMHIPYIDLEAKREYAEDTYLFEGKYSSESCIMNVLKTREHKERQEKFVEQNKGKLCYIRSDEWGSWWRAEGNGYTKLLKEAGIYEVEDAWKWTKHCGIEKGIRFVLVEECDG